MDDIYGVVGGKIKSLRKFHHLTQQELAEKSNLSIPFISQIETGHKKASLETYSKLADTFHIELGELFLYPKLKSKKPKKLVSVKSLSRKQLRYLDQFLKSLK